MIQMTWQEKPLLFVTNITRCWDIEKFTVCTRSLDCLGPFNFVAYNIKRVKNPWTHITILCNEGRKSLAICYQKSRNLSNMQFKE